jgi:ribonucleoside-triphosphate reductase (thioredoxin)
MGDGNNSDHRIEGANPCCEVGLESNELCNLCEMFPNNHDSLEEFQSTVKYAYLFAKTITLLNTQWQDTNRVMLRNRRIGLSITGISQFLANNNIDTLKKWMETAYQDAKYYDQIYSDWFAIPESIKITTAKPSGTLSLLAGSTPGIHFPESQYYIRRVRLGNDSPFIKILKESGFHIEAAIGQEESTSVVNFPVFIGENVRTINDVSMWEQLGIAAFVQKYFSDNSVSVTITFKPEEAKDIKYALDLYQYQLKAVSFLPKYESTAYPQMPYEEITKEQYDEIKSNLKEIDFSQLFSYEALGEKYCTNDTCEI